MNGIPNLLDTNSDSPMRLAYVIFLAEQTFSTADLRTDH